MVPWWLAAVTLFILLGTLRDHLALQHEMTLLKRRLTDTESDLMGCRALLRVAEQKAERLEKIAQYPSAPGGEVVKVGRYNSAPVLREPGPTDGAF